MNKTLTVNGLKFAPMGNELAEKITKIREDSGLSQENVADELGMSQGNYAKIEAGTIKISLQRLDKIASILKVHVNDLLPHTGTQKISDEILSDLEKGTDPLHYFQGKPSEQGILVQGDVVGYLLTINKKLTEQLIGQSQLLADLLMEERAKNKKSES